MPFEMNIVWAIVFLAGGLLILWKAADLLVSGAVGLAQHLGVSPLIIGLTIVAMGTSAPEVAASIAAVARGMGDTAIGNVFGSNIANLALIGGVTALIRPLQIERLTLRREIPVMFAVALLLWPILHNLSLSRLEALLLLVIFVVLILLTILAAKKGITNEERATGDGKRATSKSLLFIVIGLAGLALGAEGAVRGAIVIGKQIGLSEAVIGLTIIAIGTSLPELATCAVAAIKGHHDISVGNLVGSNIFNTLLVTGAAGTIWPFKLTTESQLMEVDYWIMISASAAFGLVAFVCRRRIGRIGGALLLSGYVVYMTYVFGFTPRV